MKASTAFIIKAAMNNPNGQKMQNNFTDPGFAANGSLSGLYQVYALSQKQHTGYWNLFRN
jgi:hypothetical protein